MDRVFCHHFTVHISTHDRKKPYYSSIPASIPADWQLPRGHSAKYGQLQNWLCYLRLTSTSSKAHFIGLSIAWKRAQSCSICRLKSGDGLLREAKQAIGPWVRGDLAEWDTDHLLQWVT